MKIKHLRDVIHEFDREWRKKYPFPVKGEDILMCPHYKHASYEESPCRECLTGVLVKREFAIIDSIQDAIQYESDE